jgi:hypothetical protein
MKNKINFNLLAKAIPLIIKFKTLYLFFGLNLRLLALKLMISTIIFFFIVIISLLLYIQTIGSETEIYTGLSYSLLNIFKVKNKNKNDTHKWTTIYYETDNIIFDKDILKKYINLFWKQNIKSLNENKHIIILCKIKKNNGQIATLGLLQKLNKEDKDYFFEYLSARMEFMQDSYINVPIIEILFSYGIRDGLAKEKNIDNKIKYQYYQHYKLPITFDPLKYGILIHLTNNIYTIQLINNNIGIITTTRSEAEAEEDKINYIKFFKNGKLIFEWKDIYIDENTFIREIGKNKFTFVNEDLKLLTIDHENKFIEKTKTAKTQNSNIITMDLETRILDNKHIPYCISIYDGKSTKSFFINDYSNNVNNMIIDSIKYLSIR